MKNKFIKLSIFIALVIGTFFSCQRDFDSLIDQGAATLGLKSAAIEDAKSWYEVNKPQEMGLKSANIKNRKQYAKPSWENAFSKPYKKGIETVMAPLSMQGSICFPTAESAEAYKQTKNEKYLRTLTYMIVETEKAKKKTQGFLMTIVPDKAFSKAKRFKTFSSTYKNWQKDFSGYILYHNLSGDFVNGWKFENGQIIKKVKQNNEGQGNGVQLKSANEYVCIDLCVDVYEQICTDWYTYAIEFDGQNYQGITSYNGRTCQGWYYAGQNCYTECWDDTYNTPPYSDPGSSSGGGGGGYNPVPEPAPTAAEVLFENVKKINMGSERLLQEISCLIRTLVNSGQPVFIPDVIEGVGNTYVNGYEYTQNNFNYQGHNVEIVVIYDPINETNHVGTRVEEQGSQIVFYEIYVKAKMQETRKMPNLIRLKFDPNDRDFFNSVWEHIKGETNLWDCN